MTFQENALSYAHCGCNGPRKLGILVVDDEAGIRALLNIVMQHEGFAVWLTANGQEALGLYRENHAVIDVVLMDVRMPEKDGPQTLTALREVNSQVRCCFISGDLGKYSEGQLRSMGAAAVLYKPFRLTEVANIVRNLVTEAESSALAL